MSTLVIVLRVLCLLAFAGPMLLVASRRHREPGTQASQAGGGQTPTSASLAVVTPGAASDPGCVAKPDSLAAPGMAAVRSATMGRAPVIANLAAFGLFVPSLLIFSGSAEASIALPPALSGCLLTLAGAALVLRSRAELGSAWSLAPKADHRIGLVTTGPYRLVRHPIYLGLVLVALGQALAFASWPAFLVVLAAIVPTFVWRARAEEKLLSRTFGEGYEAYRRRTGMIMPHLLQMR